MIEQTTNNDLLSNFAGERGLTGVDGLLGPQGKHFETIF